MTTFNLSETEEAALKKFQRHRCAKKKGGEGYSPLPQFIISPTSIGDRYEVLCRSCGKRKDITDYASW
jgi:hypothetical protein